MKRFLLLLLIVLVAAAGLTAWAYRSDLNEARARLLAGSRLAITPCGTIEYAVVGEGSPVLAVHGAGGGYTQLMELGGTLQRAGFQTILPSRFGYLRTPMPDDASPAAQAEAHRCLLDALGIKRAAVVGVSAGSPSSLEFCIRHRRRCAALVLLVPAVHAPGRRAVDITPPSPFMGFVLEHVLMSDIVMWMTMHLAPQVLVQTALATPLTVYATAGPAERARALALIRDTFPVSLRRTGIRNDARVSLALKPLPLNEITAPALLVSVRDDLYGTLAGARYTARQVPNARLVVYPSGGHLWLGHHEALEREVLDFLKRTMRAGAPG